MLATPWTVCGSRNAGNRAGYRILFNEYLAYWPTFDTDEPSTWYIGIFESMTALAFFQTRRTLSSAALASAEFNGEYFSSDTTWTKTGICYGGLDDDCNVRWGYVFASGALGTDVTALGGIGLDTLGGVFVNGLSSGDSASDAVKTVATYGGEDKQTSYPVEIYGREFSGDTYATCADLPEDADSGVYYTHDVVPIYCDNEVEGGGWTLLFKSSGANTEITWTSDILSGGEVLAKDPASDSVNTDSEDAVLWTFSSLVIDQFLFVWPESDDYLASGHMKTAMTAVDFFNTYLTYQNDTDIKSETTLVFGRQYYDGGVCTRSSILDCTTKYFADGNRQNLLTFSPAPSPMFEPTYSSNAYVAVGNNCNTFGVLSTDEDGGYVNQGSVGAAIVYCGALCDDDVDCVGFQLRRVGCSLVSDVSAAMVSAVYSSNLAITAGDICYSKVDMLFTTAPPPIWDVAPPTVFLGDDFNGWGLWDPDVTELHEYCADTSVKSSCTAMTLDECLTMCEAQSTVEFCSYGAYASEGFTENSADGEPGGSECCIATATCKTQTTSSKTQDAHYVIYQRLREQTSDYRACATSDDCNEAYYCAAFLLQASAGSAVILGSKIAETKVMCLPCVDSQGKTCADYGDAFDSCDVCTGYDTLADMPLVPRECGLDQYVDQTTGECADCSTSCDEGYYLKGARCVGTETEDPVTCALCKAKCAIGEYMVGSCSGTAFVDEIECVDCIVMCDAGYFVDNALVTETNACGGRGYETPVCSPCTARCNPGFYKDAECDGTGQEDAVTCVECANACEEGQYVESSCSGMGSADDTTCVDCTDECAADEYITGACDGTGTHDSMHCSKCRMICMPGQYFTERCDGTTHDDPLTCFDCTASCLSGTFMQGVCDGLGDSDSVLCTPCTKCVPGVLQSDGFNCEATCIGAVIAAATDADGAQTNVVTAPFSFIGAGLLNTAEANYAVITTGIYNVASGYASVIAGGAYNLIGPSAAYAVIAGGESNTALGSYGVIAGGSGNIIAAASEFNVIGSGLDNKVKGGNGNVVLGGHANAVVGTTSSYNVIAGGQYNTINGKWTAILGGKSNLAEGNYNLIAGGDTNKIVASNFAAISGGQKNTVVGKCSMALGVKAETRADHAATFGFAAAICQTRAAKVVNFCADEVAINGQPVLTLFVGRRRELEEHEEATLQSVSAVVFRQEEELAELDADIDAVLEEINALRMVVGGEQSLKA